MPTPTTSASTSVDQSESGGPVWSDLVGASFLPMTSDHRVSALRMLHKPVSSPWMVAAVWFFVMEAALAAWSAPLMEQQVQGKNILIETSK